MTANPVQMLSFMDVKDGKCVVSEDMPKLQIHAFGGSLGSDSEQKYSPFDAQLINSLNLLDKMVSFI